MSETDYIRVAAAFASDNEIKTNFASSTSTVSLGPADLNGTVGAKAFSTSSVGAVLRRPTITTTGPGTPAFNVTDPILVFGLDVRGNPIEGKVMLTNTNGGETVDCDTAMSKLRGLLIPAQVAATGTFKIGLGDIDFSPECSNWVAGAAGTFKVTTAAGFDRDVVAANGDKFTLAIKRLRRANATYPFTAFVAYV